MRSVQTELKAAYPSLWPSFVTITPKKYLDTPVAVYASAGQLQETHGSSVLGGIPDFAHFEAVALARAKKCQLITAGKALGECKSIATKGGIPNGSVGTITDV